MLVGGYSFVAAALFIFIFIFIFIFWSDSLVYKARLAGVGELQSNKLGN